ncbi:unnamed protein product, partial [Mesorhabditis spiculigera]
MRPHLPLKRPKFIPGGRSRNATTAETTTPNMGQGPSTARSSQGDDSFALYKTPAGSPSRPKESPNNVKPSNNELPACKSRGERQNVKIEKAALDNSSPSSSNQQEQPRDADIVKKPVAKFRPMPGRRIQPFREAPRPVEEALPPPSSIPHVCPTCGQNTQNAIAAPSTSADRHMHSNRR